MGKRALKKSVKQLQRLFDCLGEKGGIIAPKDSGGWWTLDLEADSDGEDRKDVTICTYQKINGDILYDPLFRLTLTMKDGKIADADIQECENSTLFGTTVIDDSGYMYLDGIKEKAPQSLQSLFKNFMDNVEQGPYLKAPASVERRGES